jgi:ABC-type transport system substrate-binding protein
MGAGPASRRRDLLGAAAAALATGVARPVPAETGRAPLVVVGPWEIGGLAPARSGYVFARMQVAETLVDISEDGMPMPGLAASWSTSPDGLHWRFVLRGGARFHDGSPVTADAVARSLREATTPPAALALAPIRSIDADRDGVVAIRLKTPFGGLASLMSHYSAIILAPASYGRDGAVKSIVATGPYRITTLAPPQQLDAERFDAWPGDGPPPEVARGPGVLARPRERDAPVLPQQRRDRIGAAAAHAHRQAQRGAPRARRQPRATRAGPRDRSRGHRPRADARRDARRHPAVPPLDAGLARSRPPAAVA